MNVGHELARGLRAAYWAMHRRTNAVLVQHGVTADQFVLLSCLADDDGITQQELAARASSDANTIRPMLLLLQKRGLITRRAHAHDGRAHCVELTAQGRRRFAGMMKATEQVRRKVLAGVKQGSPKGLLKNLNQIAQIFEKMAANKS